ncbi:MAG: SoxR reducing system RseC family protein [Gammaproteobacteria bacterium]|nr:SoxR reducing system RseC family protein [Gammaproteobacteria bacterium]
MAAIVSLRTCGTVVRRQKQRVLVAVDHETCANCNGACIKFSFPRTISAEGDYPVGKRVLVTASTRALLLASFIVFGLPVLLLLCASLIWQSPLSIAAVGVSCFLLVFVATRNVRFSHLLRTRAESL